MKVIRKPAASAEEYWKHAIALYVRNKRRERAKGQKELPVVRQTLSLVENAKMNFTLENLLEILAAVDGDISEAFKSHVPKAFHGPDQPLHEMLQQILDTRDPEAMIAIQRDIRNAFSEFVQRKTSDIDR